MTRYLCVLLCLLIAPVWADLYKWTDQNGKVHYSDQPPPANAKKSAPVKVITPPPAAATPQTADAPRTADAKGSAAAKTPAEQEMEFRQRRLKEAEAEAKAQKDAQAQEDKKRNCQRAKDQVASLERGGRVTRPGSDGEQIYLSDKEIAQELASAKKTADSWCK